MDRNVKARKDLKEKVELTREQIAYERKITIERTELDIKMMTREMIFKKAELNSGEIVEKNESNIYQMSTFPKDEKKPSFVIENEIDILERRIYEKQSQIDKIKQLELEDATKPTEL